MDQRYVCGPLSSIEREMARHIALRLVNRWSFPSVVVSQVTDDTGVIKRCTAGCWSDAPCVFNAADESASTLLFLLPHR